MVLKNTIKKEFRPNAMFVDVMLWGVNKSIQLYVVESYGPFQQ